MFDSVNCHPGGSRRGKLRRAVKPNSEHFVFWQRAINILKKIKFEDQFSKTALKSGKHRLVRVPSLDGWICTLESFIRLSNILFTQYDVDYFYTRYINQDPLENFFGRIRALNYRNTNPDCWTFVNSFKSLLLTNVLSPDSKYANCEVDNGETIIDLNFLFESKDSNKENVMVSPLSISQEDDSFASGSDLKIQAKKEKMSVQCSAYTAGFVAKKINAKTNCKKCYESCYCANAEDVHKYILYREYKALKNRNLAYPKDNFVRLYRLATNIIHNFLNEYGHKILVRATLKKYLEHHLHFSWLGCSKHKKEMKERFINYISKLHTYYWCIGINRILKGSVEEKFARSKIQNLALKKHKILYCRKKTLNK